YAPHAYVAHLDAVYSQRLQIVEDESPNQPDQVADFGRGPRPVFRAEGKNRQVEDAELVGGANDAAQCLDAAAVTFGARQTAGRSPTSVAVHDDGHMQRAIRTICPLAGGSGGIRHQSVPRKSPLLIR